MKKKKILIVEDNLDHANLITEIMLERENKEYEKEIILIRDGQEALELFMKEDTDYDENAMSGIDLVLLDLNLPKVRGMEVLKFIRKSLKHSTVPVIILSSNYDQAIILEAYNNGANGFIAKPVSSEEFGGVLMEIEEHLLNEDRNGAGRSIIVS